MVLVCMPAGRDWKACAAYVGTRDSRAIASHAQKHFVRLCIDGQALPAKVAESGAGYTLSGKPLDPESAAAKAYGFKAGILERKRPSINTQWQAQLLYMCRLDINHTREQLPQACARPAEPVWRASKWTVERGPQIRRTVTAPMLPQHVLKVRLAMA